MDRADLQASLWPSVGSVLVSGRAAVRILMDRGAMSGEAQTRALLRTGVAGCAGVTENGVLFDRETGVALAERPWLPRSVQDDACPLGLYLARLGRSVELDLTRSWNETAHAVSLVPRMPPMTSAILAGMIEAFDRLPWVATFHGFVVLGADLVGVVADGATSRFCLEPPGDWFDSWRGVPVASSRGGRPWVLRGPSVT